MHPNKIIDYSKIKKISKNDIAIGKSFTHLEEFANAINSRSADIFQPDVTQLGFQSLFRIHKILLKSKKKQYCISGEAIYRY